jgi:hypothetical protein
MWKLIGTFCAVIVLIGGGMGVSHAYSQKKAIATFLNKLGPEITLEVLNQNLSQDAHTHQLTHFVGEYLYTHEGVSGITRCKAYLSGACYHGFMIALITEHSIHNLDDVFQECTRSLAHEQPRNCAHAAGHGFLAHVGYAHLPDALLLCKKTFTQKEDITECFNGIFMQNNFGAFSAPPAGRWYKQDDPMYPCNTATVLEAGAHDSCWLMQSQLTLQNDSYPQFEHDVEKVGTYCAQFKTSIDRRLCLKGIGRQLQQITNNNPALIRAECSKIRDSLMARWCVYYAAQTAYYFGDREREAWSVNICSSEKPAHTHECELSILSGILWSYESKTEREAACTHLPIHFDRAECMIFIQNPEKLFSTLEELVYGTTSHATAR